MSLRLVIGLGNPGSQYANTRHNIGFMVLDRLAAQWGWPWRDNKRFKGLCAEGAGPASKLLLLKPTTYMNNSGESVRAVLDYYRFTAQDILVIYDDTALPTGKIRLRTEGSAGGHNGVKSLIAHLGTQTFARLRVGIDAKPPEQDLADYVLGKFSPQQAERLPSVLEGAVKAVETALHEGLEKAMNRSNSQEF
ncbi:MAG: aminoacyl-tRNA hydrolase [Gemmatimonadaceae bacterium]|nr:aminoacyl-tRNA hydrolase [Gloeobacterales cyanobacterium ES-bin-141]